MISARLWFMIAIRHLRSCRFGSPSVFCVFKSSSTTNHLPKGLSWILHRNYRLTLGKSRLELLEFALEMSIQLLILFAKIRSTQIPLLRHQVLGNWNYLIDITSPHHSLNAPSQVTQMFHWTREWTFVPNLRPNWLPFRLPRQPLF